MSYIESTNKVLLANETYTSKTIKVDPQYLSLHISIRTDKSGTLKVFQSQYNKNFETYNDEYDVEPGTTYKQVQLKGVYLYIVYVNGNESQTDFQLVSKLSDQNISVGVTIQDSLMYAKNATSGVVTVLKVDNDGKLLVTGSGGSGGGDASASNQLTQIQKAETTNEKLTAVNLSLDYLKTESHIQTLNQEAINQELDSIDAELVSLNSKIVKCDTDNVIIDSSNPVQIVGLAKVYNTLNNAFMTVDADQNLRVNVQNQIDTNSLALESTQQDVKTILQNTFTEINEMKTEILNPTSVQPITGVITVDNQPTSIQVTNIPSGHLDCYIVNTDQGSTLNVNVQNASLPVSISGTVPISTSSHLDVNCFGSSDGIQFHHLKTNNVGVLSTNALIETDNGALTSTVSGTINALDVNISNAQVNSLVKGIDSTSQLPVNIESNNNSLNSYITNTVTTKTQNSTSTQISLNEYCYCQGSATNKALNSGLSVNTNGFLYANAFLNITNFTNSSGNYNYPNIYIQSSPDGTNWLNESSTQVSGNGASKVQLYNMNVFPYLRLYVSNDYITTPNSVTFNVSSWIVQK